MSTNPIDAESLRARYVTNMKAFAQELIDHIERHLATDGIIVDPSWDKLDHENRISLRFDLRDMLDDSPERSCCDVIRSYICGHFTQLGYNTFFTDRGLNLLTREVENDLT